MFRLILARIPHALCYWCLSWCYSNVCWTVRVFRLVVATRRRYFLYCCYCTHSNDKSVTACSCLLEYLYRIDIYCILCCLLCQVIQVVWMFLHGYMGLNLSNDNVTISKRHLTHVSPTFIYNLSKWLSNISFETNFESHKSNITTHHSQRNRCEPAVIKQSVYKKPTG